MDAEPIRRFQTLRWPLSLFILLLGLSAWAWVVKPDFLFGASEHPEQQRFAQPAGKPVALTDAFTSFEAEAAVVTRLQGAELAYERSRTRRPVSAEYPPRDLTTLTVPEYRHLGVEGELRLLFFNDRLFEVHFVPREVERYAEGLARTYPGLDRDPNGRAEWVQGTLRIASNVELARSAVGRTLDTQPYVLWQDLSLVRLRDEWDARFGALPTPILED